MHRTISEKIVSVPFENGFLNISFPISGGVRLQWSTDGSFLHTDILVKEPELRSCVVQCNDSATCVQCGALAVDIEKDMSIRISDHGTERWRTPSHALQNVGEWTRLQFESPPKDAVYGLGQDPMVRLDHNHQERRMWNQWGGHERSGNYGIGLAMSTGGWGMLLATPAAARFCMNESDAPVLDPLGEAMVPSPWSNTVCPQSEGKAMVEVYGELDLFVLLGNFSELLREYYELTGYPALMPKWAYGFLQCRNRYLNQSELLKTARRMREKGISCDALIIDWLWFREFGDLEWNENDWPEPEEMFQELEKLGFRAMSAQHPFISPEGKYYREMEQAGFLNRVPEGKRITYDHTNKRARDAWWKRVSTLYRQGLRGYWTDMGELEEHFEGTESAAGERMQTHNSYSLYWSKGLAEGQRSEFGTRAMILSRSGCAGIQRYGTAVWSGDIEASWKVLRDQIVLGQMMAMSGIPWWGTDIGGFLSKDDFTPELYVRWMEWGVFCGLFRTHGTRPGNEPWSFGPQAEVLIKDLIRLRYQLLPYIYSVAVQCAQDGTPLVRPLAWECSNEYEGRQCEDEFFFGPSILVAPVTAPSVRSRRVWFPEGTWFSWWDGREYSSGWHNVAAPLGRPPFFVRAGAVIPIYTEVGRNAQECAGLCFLGFPKGIGDFSFYDDDGDGFGYERGDTLLAHLHCEDGEVQVRCIRGAMPEFTTRCFAPIKSDALVELDCFGCQTACVTMTFLRTGNFDVKMTVPSGWRITACSAGGCSQEMYEPRYLEQWSGRISGEEGDSVYWNLSMSAVWRPLGYQNGLVTVCAEGGHTVHLPFTLGSDCLDSPQILACLPEGASAGGFAPESDSGLPEYDWAGKKWRWTKDQLARSLCFGYVDFRRFDPPRRGEEMSGEGWAKEILYSKEKQNAKFEMRYDSPITIWLNGSVLYAGSSPNELFVPLEMPLKKGENIIIVRQIAEIERPYSGAEFGYQLRFVGKNEIYTWQ